MSCRDPVYRNQSAKRRGEAREGESGEEKESEEEEEKEKRRRREIVSRFLPADTAAELGAVARKPSPADQARPKEMSLEMSWGSETETRKVERT